MASWVNGCLDPEGWAIDGPGETAKMTASSVAGMEKRFMVRPCYRSRARRGLRVYFAPDEPEQAMKR